MELLVHIVVFLCSIAIVWFFAGILIESVNRIAHRFHKTGFITAFFLLGFLTSISEISVAVNSGIAGFPGVSTGNLIGASFVILLFIVPLLAVAGKGVVLKGSVSSRNLLLMLGVIVLPALLVLDGDVTKTEGLLAVLAYATLAYVLNHERRRKAKVHEELKDDRGGLMQDVAKIVIGAVAIFAAAHFLVEQAVYFATALNVPPSLIGLILLSIGTNIPEIVIALRSILKKRVDIAFGDYLGSAAMNTFIFGGLALADGTYLLESGEFIVTTILMVTGLVALYFFAKSKSTISRKEGALLLLFYAAFVGIQTFNVIRFSLF